MGNRVSILVFGTSPPCQKCLRAEKEARQAAAQFPPGEVTVEKQDAFSETGQKYGVMITPAVVINGRMVAAGRLLTEPELVELIKKERGD
ncbi:thioredoxin family protein [Desulfofundulus sp. TPOSR]|uniref:thioredoxin family protein n=1 Tax=Desulfofundulus sp. TPOSR TaxID=2714340 RepID=UPI00140C6C8F|nr:thioredoxin family protein [Desulfofundulus sp. TPOSR]NHM26672.1 thioredoxin family protein [Desulfofundulus sp. TPOSR]